MIAALITSLCSITFCQVSRGFLTGNLPVITLAHSASPGQAWYQQLLWWFDLGSVLPRATKEG